VRELQSFGLSVQIADPLADTGAVVHEHDLALTEIGALKPADAVILAVAHDPIRQGWLAAYSGGC